MKSRNHVKEIREAKMLSQRRIVLALGLKVTQKRRVFRDS
jgi:hypothetical protein